MTYEHWNNPGMLPPVNCPLVIRLDTGSIRHVERTTHLTEKNGDMEYRERLSGLVYRGRFAWSYP